MPPALRAAFRRRVPLRVRTRLRRLAGRGDYVRPPRYPAVRAFDLVLPVLPTRSAGSPALNPVLRASAAPSLHLVTDGSLIVPRLLEKRGLAGYEPDAIACFMAAIESTGAACVFDVGANVGLYAALAASLTSATVVAFEPTPTLVDVGRTIFAENGLDGRFEPVALGDTEGHAELYLSPTDSSNSLLKGFRQSTSSLDVVVRTLDAYCAETGLAPQVIKIDTEATEPAVLRGGRGVIAEHRPWIICEILAGRTETQLTPLLAELRYRAFKITTSSPLEEADVIIGDPTYRYMNWLLAPAPLDPAFQAAMDRWRAVLSACHGTEAAVP